ncbi:hypothetical protein [Arsenophonus nasoniae]|nr:hypothetical protein [Arsenophonus nasoniae]
MNRHNIIFDINYSYYLEEMFSTLTGRIHKLISVILFILGGSVFTPFSNLLLFGAFVSCLSAIQYFYEYAKHSCFSNIQAKRYLALIYNESTLSDDELHQKFNELQKSDTQCYGLLANAAYKRTSIKLGLDDHTKLTRLESIFAWFAGDLPKA